MKRTITLSLLLLIAGNGLIVTQAHAGFLDTLKNKASQYSVDSNTQKLAQEVVGAVCFGLGLGCLLSAFVAASSTLPAWQRNLDSLINIEKERCADGKTMMVPGIRNSQNDIKSLRTDILKALALGIPLTALGAYLMKKG